MQMVELTWNSTDPTQFLHIFISNIIIMETEITSGTRLLNGFLKVMVVVLVGILISVVVGLILAAVGIL